MAVAALSFVRNVMKSAIHVTNFVVLKTLQSVSLKIVETLSAVIVGLDAPIVAMPIANCAPKNVHHVVMMYVVTVLKRLWAMISLSVVVVKQMTAMMTTQVLICLLIKIAKGTLPITFVNKLSSTRTVLHNKLLIGCLQNQKKY